MKKEIAEKISEMVSKMIETDEGTVGYGPEDKDPIKIHPLTVAEAMEMVRVKWDGEKQLYIICKGNIMYEAFLKPDGEKLSGMVVSKFRG